MFKETKQETCPVCGEGKMIAHTDGTFKFKYQRRNYVVHGTHYAKCDHCNTSGYLSGQRAYNNKLIEAFQQSLVSIISPTQILALREKYSLSQEKASKIFGGGINGFSRWERGTVVPAEPTAKLMLIALEDPQTLIRLAKISNVELELPIITEQKNHQRRKSDNEATLVLSKQRHFDTYQQIVPVSISYPALIPNQSFNRSERIKAILTAVAIDDENLEPNIPWPKENPTQYRIHN